MKHWLVRPGHHFVLTLMLASRLLSSFGAMAVVYYVNLTLSLPESISRHFQLAAVPAVIVSVVLTILLALWETRRLRRVLLLLEQGQPVPPSLGFEAGREAVLFPVRHHRHEAWLVPATTYLPVALFLAVVDHASWAVLSNLALACGMGIAMALMSTFFAIERGMQPVIRYLLDQGVMIPFDSLPTNKLRSRLNLCFSLIILITALMIGTMARQRATEIIQNPQNQAIAVHGLRTQTTYITIVAVAVGVVLSTVLAQSVASRVAKLVVAMRRVEQGDLSERVQPTGNDEIDILARQFNAMVAQLDQSHQTIHDLNTNLESTVKRRTRQLSKSKRELQHSLAQLREYDRLKTEFFSNVSHELRTPLTMILSPVEQILKKYGSELPAEASYLLKVAEINGQRLLELIHRLLEFSKLEAGRASLHLTSVDVNRMVSKVANAAAPLTQQRAIQLQVHCDEKLPAIGADEEKIDTVISNLLSNAIKFTPPGGKIRIETALEQDQVRISVSDSGIGIAPADQERIFERFVQLDGSTSREFPGTGLGLALARELVELHQGRIQVDSAVGQGSRFWFHLPLVPAPAPEIVVSPPSTDTPWRSRFADLVTCPENVVLAETTPAPCPANAPRILVIDDTPEVPALMRSVLSGQYRVLSADDGTQGLARARQELPDLVICDVMMPGLDGYELCRHLKQDPATQHIPLILLTARAERMMKIEGLECGADDYLVKPFDPDELQARIRSLLNLRRLHQALDQRNTELEAALQELKVTQARLLKTAHRAGMTEIASGVLHNVGNVLNSVNVSLATLDGQLQRLRLPSLVKTADLLHQHAGDLASFLTTDRKGQLLPGYLGQLATNLLADQENMRKELAFLKRKLQDIRTIISAQQKYARQIPFKEAAAVADLIGDVLAMHTPSLSKHQIQLVRHFEPVPVANLEKLKLVQILDNLVRNALDALTDQEVSQRVLTIRIQCPEAGRVRVSVSDTGRGIARENLQQIFHYGFTTKVTGNGFGLHSAANAMAEMGGTIQAYSEGLGRGATFTLEFPLEVPGAAEGPLKGAPQAVAG